MDPALESIMCVARARSVTFSIQLFADGHAAGQKCRLYGTVGQALIIHSPLDKLILTSLLSAAMSLVVCMGSVASARIFSHCLGFCQ